MRLADPVRAVQQQPLFDGGKRLDEARGPAPRVTLRVHVVLEGGQLTARVARRHAGILEQLLHHRATPAVTARQPLNAVNRYALPARPMANVAIHQDFLYLVTESGYGLLIQECS